MRLSLGFIVALLGLSLLPLFPSPTYGQLTLADIIANVRQNERLYENIEVTMQSTYDIGDRPPRKKTEVIRKQLRTRFVSQGEWFRLEREGGSQDSGRIASRNRIRAFDGETTRLFEQRAVGNISRERLEDADFIRPHLLLIRYAHIAVPFSVYLSGHNAIQMHPNGRWDKDLTMQVSYRGEEEFNGLKCHKILVKKILLNSGEPHDGEEHWLAEDRNYLPVRLLAYTYRFSKDIPVGQGIVNKLREIKPGVWFPFDVEVSAYNKIKIQREGRQELQWRERYVVERAELDPHYNREFFAKVDFPNRTAVYEVENHKINKSWRVGAPEAPSGPTARKAATRWWRGIVAAILTVLAAALAIFRIRKARRTRSASSGGS